MSDTKTKKLSKFVIMKKDLLPKQIEKVIVPPIKCQGIKTKLVKFIAESIRWKGEGRWIEPFLGSGVVLFNINPKKALVGDSNKHIIRFYLDIQSGAINEVNVQEYLENMNRKLKKFGKEFYYDIREQFNEDGDSLKLLFLNRSCFNGIMRFNSNGKFNVPFGHKPERFRRPYITKIVNQVARIRNIMKGKDWSFVVSDWRDLLEKADETDFVYLDPPYIGRHTDYFNNWNDVDAVQLARTAGNLSCGFALSMWKENKYRINQHLDLHWDGFIVKTFDHFYHVGSQEKFRNKMTEALVLKPGFVANHELVEISNSKTEKQISMHI